MKVLKAGHGHALLSLVKYAERQGNRAATGQRELGIKNAHLQNWIMHGNSVSTYPCGTL